jgi:serine phosphatase RsbU (regulator of sigma subunit)
MVEKGFDLQAIVTEINKKLIRDTPQDRFVAAILIQTQQEQKKIDVWNGGMPTAYWVDEGEVLQAFSSRHMALGILDESMFDASVITCNFFGKGVIIAYSDGLIEEVNAQGRSFSSARMANLVRARVSNLHTFLITSLREYAGRDQYRDDVSICMLELDKIFASCAKQLKDRPPGQWLP